MDSNLVRINDEVFYEQNVLADGRCFSASILLGIIVHDSYENFPDLKLDTTQILNLTKVAKLGLENWMEEHIVNQVNNPVIQSTCEFAKAVYSSELNLLMINVPAPRNLVRNNFTTVKAFKEAEMKATQENEPRAIEWQQKLNNLKELFLAFDTQDVCLTADADTKKEIIEEINNSEQYQQYKKNFILLCRLLTISNGRSYAYAEPEAGLAQIIVNSIKLNIAIVDINNIPFKIFYVNYDDQNNYDTIFVKKLDFAHYHALVPMTKEAVLYASKSNLDRRSILTKVSEIITPEVSLKEVKLNFPRFRIADERVERFTTQFPGLDKDILNEILTFHQDDTLAKERIKEIMTPVQNKTVVPEASKIDSQEDRLRIFKEKYPKIEEVFIRAAIDLNSDDKDVVILLDSFSAEQQEPSNTKTSKKFKTFTAPIYSDVSSRRPHTTPIITREAPPLENVTNAVINYKFENPQETNTFPIKTSPVGTSPIEKSPSMKPTIEKNPLIETSPSMKPTIEKNPLIEKSPVRTAPSMKPPIEPSPSVTAVNNELIIANIRKKRLARALAVLKAELAPTQGGKVKRKKTNKNKKKATVRNSRKIRCKRRQRRTRKHQKNKKNKKTNKYYTVILK